MKRLFSNIVRIGINSNDDDNVALGKRFLVFQGLAMSMGGLLWGTLLLVFNYPIPSIIPYGYALITIINFFIFNKTKNFVVARNIQTIISLCLPFILQWFLGGFEESGGVMLWSLLSLVSSVSYQNTRSSIYLLISYVVFTLFSIIYDSYFEANFNMGVEEYISHIFLVINILCVSAIVFALFLYYARMNTTNMLQIKKTYLKLINSEKLAALGQISAGIAHEINTPLGAIKSSAEESAIGFEEFVTKLPSVLKSMSSDEKDFFVRFVATIESHSQFLSTKEEREKKKNLRTALEGKNVTNPRFVSDRLVQVGIYELTPEIEMLTKHSNFEELIMVTYNLLNQQKNNKTIVLAVDKASRIVLALKSYLHTSGNEEPEPVNIIDNLETVLTILNNRLKQGIEVIKDFETVLEVLAISDKVNQVWTNLIVNAIQAMDNKGTLTIGVKPAGDFVEVRISDTGKGIPIEIQEKIFDPFFTTKASGEGSGLGLDIIKNILTDHSGTISFESKVNEGTTFYVKLPVSKT